AYAEQYGRLIEGVDVEILAWTVTVAADAPRTTDVATVRREPAATPAQRLPVFDLGESRWIEAGLHQRSGLQPGSTLAGPAVIAEDTTSTVISGDFEAVIAGD